MERHTVFARLFGHKKQFQSVDGQGSIVVGRGVRIPWSGWRKFYVIGCVLLIIAAAISSFFAWRANTHSHEARVNGEGALQASIIQAAATDDHAGNYGDEVALLKGYLKNNPPERYRYEPLMILGNLAYGKRDDAGALKYYEAAVASNSSKLTAFDADSIAQAAQASGNKSTAIKYYKLEIKLTKVEPGVANNTDELKQIIVHLGGTP